MSGALFPPLRDLNFDTIAEMQMERERERAKQGGFQLQDVFDIYTMPTAQKKGGPRASGTNFEDHSSFQPHSQALIRKGPKSRWSDLE